MLSRGGIGKDPVLFFWNEVLTGNPLNIIRCYTTNRRKIVFNATMFQLFHVEQKGPLLIKDRVLAIDKACFQLILGFIQLFRNDRFGQIDLFINGFFKGCKSLPANTSADMKKKGWVTEVMRTISPREQPAFSDQVFAKRELFPDRALPR